MKEGDTQSQVQQGRVCTAELQKVHRQKWEWNFPELCNVVRPEQIYFNIVHKQKIENLSALIYKMYVHTME